MQEQGGYDYEKAKQGILVVTKLPGILILEINKQTFTCNKTAQN